MNNFFEVWGSFIYLYLVGGIFFFSGMYIIKKSGALNTKRKSHKFWLKTLYGGFLFFFSIHFLSIIAALYL
ncbi:MAG: hypothetical protein IPM32_08215 [Ignavibacteriae bacterium]|nr:hypothetical protein [Ignavibacteriota bacterium]